MPPHRTARTGGLSTVLTPLRRRLLRLLAHLDGRPRHVIAGMLVVAAMLAAVAPRGHQ